MGGKIPKEKVLYWGKDLRRNQRPLYPDRKTEKRGGGWMAVQKRIEDSERIKTDTVGKG